MEKSIAGVDEDHDEVSHRVHEHVEKYHPNLGIKKEQVYGVCKLFIDYGTRRDQLEAALCSSPLPPILLQNLSLLRDVLSVFRQHRISMQTALRSLTAYNVPFNMQPDTLNKTLLKLRIKTIDNVTLLRYLEICPFLIYVTGNLELKLHNLKSIFPPGELKHLLFNYPHVLLEPWENIEQKLFYIHDEMGLDQPHVVFCKVLSHPLHHIINRHQFLVRIGLYTKPKLFRDRLSHLVNTKLEYIMDCTDAQFCKRVAGVSPEEFEVFKALAAEERGENLDGVPMNVDDDDTEYEQELLEKKLSFRQYGEGAPPVRGPRWLSTGNRKPIDGTQ